MLPLSCPTMGHYVPKLTSCTNYTTHLIFDTAPIKTFIFLLLFSSLFLSSSPWKYISNHSYSLFSFLHQSIICTFTRELYFRFLDVVELFAQNKYQKEILVSFLVQYNQWRGSQCLAGSCAIQYWIENAFDIPFHFLNFNWGSKKNVKRCH